MYEQADTSKCFNQPAFLYKKMQHLSHTAMHYNQPILVEKEIYIIFMTKLSGIVAGRIDGDKYYIKLMVGRYKDYVNKLFKQYF